MGAGLCPSAEHLIVPPAAYVWHKQSSAAPTVGVDRGEAEEHLVHCDEIFVSGGQQDANLWELE